MEDIENLKQQLEELKKLRDELSAGEEKITKNAKSVKKQEEVIQNVSGILASIKKELDAIDQQVKELEEEVKNNAKEYEESYKRLSTIIDEYNKEMDSDKLLTEEEIDTIKSANEELKLEENAKSKKIKRTIDEEKKVIAELKAKKTRMENTAKKADALGLTLEEYNEIIAAVRKTTIMNKILEKKGLADIIDKKPQDRTKEEKELLKEARKEVIDEISQVKKANEEYSVLDAIEALYSLEVTYEEKKKPRVMEIKKNELTLIKEQAVALPYRIINPNINNVEYTPEETPKDMEEVMPREEEKIDISSLKPAEERVTLFKDTTTDNYYVRKYAVNRFKLKSADMDNEVRINGSLCYKISEADVEKIKENADNSMSPYIADIKEITLEKEINPDEVISNEDVKSVIDEQLQEITKDDSNKSEEIKDEEIEEFVTKEDNLNNEQVEEISFEDMMEAKLTEADNAYIAAEQNLQRVLNDPKATEEDIALARQGVTDAVNNYIDVSNATGLNDRIIPHVGESDNKETKLNNETPINVDEIVDEVQNSNEKEETDLQKAQADLDEANERVRLAGEKLKDPNVSKGYAENLFEEALNARVRAEKELEKIKNGEKLKDGEQKNTSDEEKTQTHETPLPVPSLPEKEKGTEAVVGDDTKKDKPQETRDDRKQQKEANKYAEESVEAIIQKITEGLDIEAKDGKRFTASNIKVAKNFKKELSSGNYLYNIVHVVPAVINFGVSLARKLVSKLLLGAEGKRVCEEITKRLDNLSEKELETLFNKYKGNRLKADMNNQINPLILDRLRRYAMEKVEKINDNIKQHYVELFATLEQIKVIDKKLSDKGIDGKTKELYTKQRKDALKKAAMNIRGIEASYDEANDLLSSGLHGLEEDFKAVSTKLSYVGLRFGKEYAFNNELQKLLAEADTMLVEGLKTNDDDKIVSGFMKKDKLYYENTEIETSIFGKRSSGEKYYSPYAERLDYRQDPFIRDLITTIATTSAVVSAINATRVHQIESQQLLDQQRAEAARVNGANDQIMAGVSAEASKIVAGRATIQKGLEAQMHQDVVNTAHGLERFALDHFNWTTRGNGYRALDDANHAMYNSFYDNVSQQINGIVNQYGTGAINQAQALQQMTNLAGDAQSTFIEVAQTCLNELKTYAPAHPQFDLHATQEALEYIVSNPTAITDMNAAAMNATNIAEGLIGLSPAHVEALAALPSDWTTTILNVAGSAALVSNVVRNMKARETDNSKKKWDSTSDIRDMMADYLEEEEKEEGKHK